MDVSFFSLFRPVSLVGFVNSEALLSGERLHYILNIYNPFLPSWFRDDEQQINDVDIRRIQSVHNCILEFVMKQK